MIQVHDPAIEYFARLIEQQDADGLGLYLRVQDPGTPRADCQLSFCEPDRVPADDLKIDCGEFTLYVDVDSLPWLEEAELDFESNSMGGQLVVKAPNIKGTEPGEGAPLHERVQFLLDAQINPSLASHGGFVRLVEVADDGFVVLQFGGGCHGCGMVDVTLKQGIEKTLCEALPEISGVRDVTDHSTGANPYYA